MTLSAARTWLWAHVLLLCATSVTSLNVNWNIQAPKNFWMDQSCLNKGITPTVAQESLDIALLGARRLVNLDDDYQGWIYSLLFKAVRDFALMNDDDTETWNVVEVEGWISAMKYETNRNIADVRVYCVCYGWKARQIEGITLTGNFSIDNDERWTRVPNDPIAIARGMTPNSLRIFGDDAEYEDPINFMRRQPKNQGCLDRLTLGVTYDTMSPENDPRVPSNIHSRRQTITICDLALQPRIKKFADISPREWRFMRMDVVNIIPTSVFLYQFLGLDPYHIWQDIFRNFDRRNTWPVMLAKRAIELEQAPAPYMWNAILAYAASLGWGVQQGLNAVQYFHGVDLFRYKGALKSPPFVRGGPITLPAWMQLPPPIYEPM